jgi:hypothetical protein
MHRVERSCDSAFIRIPGANGFLEQWEGMRNAARLQPAGTPTPPSRTMRIRLKRRVDLARRDPALLPPTRRAPWKTDRRSSVPVRVIHHMLWVPSSHCSMTISNPARSVCGPPAFLHNLCHTMLQINNSAMHNAISGPSHITFSSPEKGQMNAREPCAFVV